MHSLTRPSIDGPQPNSAAGKAGDRARRHRGEGGVWTGGAECLARPGPTAARRPPWPLPRPYRPRGSPPPSAVPRSRPGAARRGTARVRRGERGSPGEPSTPSPRAGSGFPGPHTATARPAAALTSVDAARSPSGQLRAAAGLGAQPAAWVPPRRVDPRNVPKPPGPGATPARNGGAELSGARVARRGLRVATGLGLARAGQGTAAPLQL